MYPELLRPHQPPGGRLDFVSRRSKIAIQLDYSNSRGASQKNAFEHLQPLALVQGHPTDWLKSDLISRKFVTEEAPSIKASYPPNKTNLVE